MPRDNDKNNDSRGRRDRPSGGKGRSGAARGPEKKFAKRGFAGKHLGDKGEGGRPYDKKPYSGSGKPYAGKREGAPPRRDHDDAPGRDARPASRFQDSKFGDKKPYAPRDRDGDREKRPYTPRGEGFRKDGDRPRGDRPYSARPSRDGDRPGGKFGGDKKFSRGAPRDRKSDSGDRGPRKDFGSRPDRGPDRADSKPWQKRAASSPDHAGRNARPSRDGERSCEKRGYDKPRFDKPRYDKPREDRPQGDRPQGDRPFRERPKFDRPRESREDRPKFDRPRQRPEGRTEWQEHPRSEPRSFDRNAAGPRRDNEDDSKVFAKRPAFGGRGAYRERTPDFEKRAPRPPKIKKSGERIAKVVSRAGLASRRDAEEWIVQGRVTVNGRVINSPPLASTETAAAPVAGKPLPPRERTRLFLFHKPRGLMTTHADPEG